MEECLLRLEDELIYYREYRKLRHVLGNAYRLQLSAPLAAQSSAKMRLYRRFSMFGRFQTPGPHPTLSPATPALAWSRNRGQRPSAENPLRLSDRIPGV